MILLIFGDSITQGYWDEKGGWADRLKADVLKRDIDADFSDYHGVYNLGIDGDTTAQVLNRFDAESQARRWPGASYGIVFAIGTNDVVTFSDGKAESTPEEYKDQLLGLLTKARDLTQRVAFINICPVNENYTNPLQASTSGKRYTNERVILFNAALSQFCEDNQVTMIDVNAEFNGRVDELLADGLHPNGAGHEVIKDKVARKINTWLYK